MLKRTLIAVVLTIFTVSAAFAANYMEPQELRQMIEQKNR